ncbi:MAG: arsenate reductase (glutaredoxin) [Gammaproteobacteria bacterium]|nr:arsenate reductase (glutaredoxin) [Gammaproteobacteria bacterium]
MKIYFNPNCSKCRHAVAQLDENGTEYEVVRYLEDPISPAEVSDLIDMLADPLEDLVRKDQHFRDLGLVASDYLTKEAVVSLLSTHPKLMQRPIIVRDGVAAIARTPEKVEELAS